LISHTGNSVALTFRKLGSQCIQINRCRFLVENDKFAVDQNAVNTSGLTGIDQLLQSVGGGDHLGTFQGMDDDIRSLADLEAAAFIGSAHGTGAVDGGHFEGICTGEVGIDASGFSVADTAEIHLLEEIQTIDGVVNAIGIDKCKLCTYCWNGKE